MSKDKKTNEIEKIIETVRLNSNLKVTDNTNLNVLNTSGNAKFGTNEKNCPEFCVKSDLSDIRSNTINIYSDSILVNKNSNICNIDMKNTNVNILNNKDDKKILINDKGISVYETLDKTKEILIDKDGIKVDLSSDDSDKKKPLVMIGSSLSEYCGIGPYNYSDYEKKNSNGSSERGIRFASVINRTWRPSGKYDPNYCFRFDGKVYGAVWNDLVDKVEVPDDTDLKYGKCYIFDGEKYKESSKYAQKGIAMIHSDTYGLAMGSKYNTKKELNSAVAGYVLAYVDKSYYPGTPLTYTKDGYLTKANLFVRMLHPDRIVATYWKNERESKWNDIDVNNRQWVKIR